MHSHIMGYSRTWGCIPMYWGSPVYIDAFPYTGAPQCVGMHSHILGYTSIWECKSIYWGTPVYGNAFPNTGVLQLTGNKPRHKNLRCFQCLGVCRCSTNQKYKNKQQRAQNATISMQDHLFYGCGMCFNKSKINNNSKAEVDSQ